MNRVAFNIFGFNYIAKASMTEKVIEAFAVCFLNKGRSAFFLNICFNFPKLLRQFLLRVQALPTVVQL